VYPVRLGERSIALVAVTVRRERRWTSAGATPDRELVRSTAAPIFQKPRLFSSGQTDDFRSISKLIGVPYSSTGGGSDETENRAVGICGIDCRGLLGASWLGDSTLNGTRLVEPRSIDLSDCACWVPFSLRCQVVLGTSHERSRVCANRSDNGRSAAIAVSVARARAIVVVTVRREKLLDFSG
jgi:hypothetical protein